MKYVQGQMVGVKSVGIASRRTSPPPRFTEGMLIDAMTHVDRFVSNDADKKVLRDTKGLGTERTRDKIIETLLHRGYVRKEKGKLISTEIGRALIAKLPHEVSDPVTTAKWEVVLGAIEDGKASLDQFMTWQEKFVTDLVFKVRTMDMAGMGAPVQDLPKTGVTCPKCGKGRLVTRKVTNEKSKAYGKSFLRCSVRECEFVEWPEDGSRT